MGRITNSSNVISTNAYDPKQSTNVWNFSTPSTSMTKRANQQMKNIAEYLIFRFFSFIVILFLFFNSTRGNSLKLNKSLTLDKAQARLTLFSLNRDFRHKITKNQLISDILQVNICYFCKKVGAHHLKVGAHHFFLMKIE